jgi:hypothetical protein
VAGPEPLKVLFAVGSKEARRVARARARVDSNTRAQHHTTTKLMACARSRLSCVACGHPGELLACVVNVLLQGRVTSGTPLVFGSAVL